MKRTALTAAAFGISLAAAVPVTMPAAASTIINLVPQTLSAPDSNLAAAGTPAACQFPDGSGGYADFHCNTPAQIRAAYGVDQVGNATTGKGLLGKGQTIVLVDSYGSPTAAHDLNYFHDTFFKNLPGPDFSQVYPLGKPNYANANTNSAGLSGPSAAAGWSGEATLDIEWAYSIAPLAHIVLMAVPPAETLGVQGFPNMFKAISNAIDTYPAGTIFSMSFAVSEPTFNGAAAVQTAKFDQVLAKGTAKGDSFFSSAGDNGTTGSAKQHKESVTYPYATVEWPTTSPYVTSVGGTQLQDGWTWNPTSSTPFTSSGANPDYFASTPNPNGLTETVWNESWLPAATGGGPSDIYARPTWQDGVASRITNTNGQQVNARAVPDLSWDAAVNGGVLVYITAFPNYQRPGWHLYGGTSASSPQVAGLTALANENRAGAGKGPIGDVAPLLYTDSTAFANNGAFRDIVPTTQGTASAGVLDNNSMWGSSGPGPVPGHPTTPGWDMTTGFGSPLAPGYISTLTSLSPYQR
jgi:subtilase family serine protease